MQSFVEHTEQHPKNIHAKCLIWFNVFMKMHLNNHIPRLTGYEQEDPDFTAKNKEQNDLQLKPESALNYCGF